MFIININHTLQKCKEFLKILNYEIVTLFMYWNEFCNVINTLFTFQTFTIEFGKGLTA